MHYIFLFHQASKAHAIAVSDHYIVCGCTDGIIRYKNAITTVYTVEVLLTDTLVYRQLYLQMLCKILGVFLNSHTNSVL